MSDRAAKFFAALLIRWVRNAERFAWPVVVLSLISAVLCVAYTVQNAGVNTNAEEMISEELPFRQDFKTYKEAFNQFRDTIVIVIDGATPDLADQAADSLVVKLAPDTDHFEIVSYVSGSPFFRKNGLLFLDIDELYDLGDRLAAAQPLLAELVQDESLRGLFDVLTLAADEIVDGDAEAPEDLAPVLEQLTRTIDRKIEGEPAYFSWQDVMSGESTGISDRRRFISVQPVQDFGLLQPSSAAVAEVRRAIEELHLNAENGVRVRLTGSAMVSEEELAGIAEDVGRAGLISFVLVGIILFGGLRSPKIAVASLITIFVGLIWTATFAVAAVGDFNLISIAFGVLFIGLSVDFNIHYGLRYREAVADGATPSEALVSAASEIGRALSLCVVATVIAFYSFIPTAYAGVSALGLISGTGMFIALFATMTLLPALLAVMPIKLVREKRRPPFGIGLNDFLARHARPIVIGATIVGVAAAVQATQIRFDFDPINLRDPSTESIQTMRDLERDPDTTTYSIKLLEPDVERANAVIKRLEKLPAVKNAVTISNFVPKDQDEKLNIIDGIYLTLLPVIDPQGNQLPAADVAHDIEAARLLRMALEKLEASPYAEGLDEPARRLAAALGRLIERSEAAPATMTDLDHIVFATFPAQIGRLRTSMNAGKITLADLPEDLRARFLAEDGRARIEIRPSIDASTPEGMERFVTEVRSVAPNATGEPVLIIESGRAVIDAFIFATTLATVLITSLLLMLLRSIVDTLLVLMPLVLAGVLTLATAGLIDQPFNFANVIVLPLLLGLAVDGGIHMVMRDKTVADERALMQTSTPRAVVLSALTTICSFGSLAISSHQGTASMGKLLTISLAFTLIATLIVLPATLALKEKLGRKVTVQAR